MAKQWSAGGYLAGDEAPARRSCTSMTTTIPRMQLQ
jgi:hypothetical protein